MHLDIEKNYMKPRNLSARGNSRGKNIETEDVDKNSKQGLTKNKNYNNISSLYITNQ